MKAFRFNIETAIEKKKTTEFKKLNIFTWIFLGIILISVIYFVFSPIIPELIYQISLSQKRTDSDNFSIKEIPSQNTLYIPKINIDTPIYEGFSEDTLNLGLWHKPMSSNPQKGGNTVLTAIRFQNINSQNIFYELEKLENGDRYLIFWEKREYTYEVYEKIIVSNKEIAFEYNTDNAISTLYTYNQNAETRLVIRGKLIGTY